MGATQAITHARLALDQARVDLARLLEIEAQQQRQREQAVEALAVLEGGLAERMAAHVLAGAGQEAKRAEADQLVSVRVDVETADAALRGLAPKIEAARQAVVKARAACLLSEAEHLEQQVAERQQKTDALLAELQAWEGCEYAPIPPKVEQGRMRAVVENVALPKTEAMRRQAAFYRQTARDWLEGQPALKSMWHSNRAAWPLPDYLGPGFGPGDNQPQGRNSARFSP